MTVPNHFPKGPQISCCCHNPRVGPGPRQRNRESWHNFEKLPTQFPSHTSFTLSSWHDSFPFFLPEGVEEALSVQCDSKVLLLLCSERQIIRFTLSKGVFSVPRTGLSSPVVPTSLQPPKKTLTEPLHMCFLCFSPLSPHSTPR